MSHLKALLTTWLKETDDTCIVIPCDSTEAWIVAAYDQTDGIETVEAPWEHIIARRKILSQHSDIRPEETHPYI